MFIPIRTDRPIRNTPWVNYALIAANVLVFLLTDSEVSVVFNLMARGIPLDVIAEAHPTALYILFPEQTLLHQYITYQFLHAGWQHLLGNMLFLYVFGNNVEDRLGKIAYLAFYLCGGVLAGLGHTLVEPNPVLGASGAVAAVSGASLVLFPMINVTIVYWFFFIGAFEVSNMLLILFQIAQDAVMFVGHFGGVAYLAHLSGYAFGFAAGMLLLKTGLLTREPYDMMTLLEHRRRRAQFASLTRKGYQPWYQQEHKAGKGAGRRRGKAGADEKPVSPEQEKVMGVRAKIAEAAANQDLAAAARLYTELLAIDATQVMGQQQQLDIANQLMTEQSYEKAAGAYELFLERYPGYADRAQVQLILGLACARYLNRPGRARELLSAAAERLHDDGQRALAKQVLAEVGE